MHLFSLSTGLALAAVLMACAAPTVDQQRTISWLDSKTGASDLDVSGAWESANSFLTGGWGNATWVQTGQRVSGTLGINYTIVGKVVGKQLYLIILSGGRVYYTAILEPTKDGGLSGMAIAKMVADDPEARTADHTAIELVRPGSAPSKSLHVQVGVE